MRTKSFQLSNETSVLIVQKPYLCTLYMERNIGGKSYAIQKGIRDLGLRLPIWKVILYHLRDMRKEMKRELGNGNTR